MSCFTEPADGSGCNFVEDLRYLNKDNNTTLLEINSNYFLEQIAQYGIEVGYQKNNYSLEHHDFVFGEDSTRKFGDPETVIMYVSFNSDSIILGQFGIASDADVTCFIHISSFKDTFGADSEPEMGDIFELTEYGKNRPNGRGPAKFEILRRDDEDLDQINPLLGHYVWLIRGKRYDYSYENNVTPEKRINQINDSTMARSLSTIGLSADYVKTYEQTIKDLQPLIFDYDENPDSNDLIYGDY